MVMYVRHVLWGVVLMRAAEQRDNAARAGAAASFDAPRVRVHKEFIWLVVVTVVARTSGACVGGGLGIGLMAGQQKQLVVSSNRGQRHLRITIRITTANIVLSPLFPLNWFEIGPLSWYPAQPIREQYFRAMWW